MAKDFGGTINSCELKSIDAVSGILVEAIFVLPLCQQKTVAGNGDDCDATSQGVADDRTLINDKAIGKLLLALITSMHLNNY